jgi:hypothetical protein
LAGEVSPECQRPCRADSVGLGGGELGGEALSVGPIGSGRMPDPTLSTGDRIPAFVDHRVIALTSLSYISLHDVLLQSAVPAIGIRWNYR